MIHVLLSVLCAISFFFVPVYPCQILNLVSSGMSLIGSSYSSISVQSKASQHCVKTSATNHQVTSQHPLLPLDNLHPLMLKAALPMPMQQCKPRLRSHRHRLRIAVLPRSFRIEDGFSSFAGREIDEQRPSSPSRFGRVGWERQGIRVVIYTSR